MAGSISTPNIAWAAGFLEGEGSFYSPGPNTCPTVRASQVQKQPLEKLQKLFGGIIRLVNRHIPTSKAIYDWQCHGPRAAGIMMTIFQFMSPKRKEQIGKTFSRWQNTQGLQSKYNKLCFRGHANRWGKLAYKVKSTGERRIGRRCLECHNLRRKGLLV